MSCYLRIMTQLPIFFGLFIVFLNNLQAVVSLDTKNSQGQDQPFGGKKTSGEVCCSIINEAEIDLKFFTELCKSVIEREISTEAGIKVHRKDRYPPPGMMDRCRKTILEECHLDVTSFLSDNKTKKVALDKANHTSPQFKLNITQCLIDVLEKKTPTVRRERIPEADPPSYIHQERPQFVGPPPENLALKEKGSPYPLKDYSKMKSFHTEVKGNTDVLSYTKYEKKTENINFRIVEPLYKLSITIFFIFTLTKMVMKKPEDANVPKDGKDESSSYVHLNGNSCNGKANHLLTEALISDDPPSLINLESDAADDMQTACEDLTENLDMDEEDEEEEDEEENSQIIDKQADVKPDTLRTNVINNFRSLVEAEEAKIAVIGMEVQAEFPDKLTDKQKPGDLSPTIKESDGSGDDTLETVVVTGRMLISLLGKGLEADQQESQLMVDNINFSTDEM